MALKKCQSPSRDLGISPEPQQKYANLTDLQPAIRFVRYLSPRWGPENHGGPRFNDLGQVIGKIESTLGEITCVLLNQALKCVGLFFQVWLDA